MEIFDEIKSNQNIKDNMIQNDDLSRDARGLITYMLYADETSKGDHYKERELYRETVNPNSRTSKALEELIHKDYIRAHRTQHKSIDWSLSGHDQLLNKSESVDPLNDTIWLIQTKNDKKISFPILDKVMKDPNISSEASELFAHFFAERPRTASGFKKIIDELPYTNENLRLEICELQAYNYLAIIPDNTGNIFGNEAKWYLSDRGKAVEKITWKYW